LYSVAATLFSCLTGEFVFPAKNVIERLGLLISRDARSIGSVLPELPPRIVACIDRALRSDPAQRWPHAAAMQWEIRESFEELTGNRIPETRRQRLHGISGWSRPVAPVAASREPSHHTTAIDVSIVFEPEASQENVSIPIDVDTRHL
jgi:serine/threonine protein kinase